VGVLACELCYFQKLSAYHLGINLLFGIAFCTFLLADFELKVVGSHQNILKSYFLNFGCLKAAVTLFICCCYIFCLQILQVADSKKETKGHPLRLACTSPKGEDSVSDTLGADFLKLTHFLCRFPIHFRSDLRCRKFVNSLLLLFTYTNNTSDMTTIILKK
jgi:hypothetical protein